MLLVQEIKYPITYNVPVSGVQPAAETHSWRQAGQQHSQQLLCLTFNLDSLVVQILFLWSSQRCMQDLMDGFFPSELQDRFPDGVPFEVCFSLFAS